MLQFIMDRNLLLYVLAAACLAGVASQMILKQIYENLIKDTRNTGEPDGRFLQQLRQRFQYCSHLNEKVGDVQALIQKGMMEYRFWGMSLHSWRRLGVQCLVLSLLCAAGGSAFLVQKQAAPVLGNIYAQMGMIAAVLTAFAYGISDVGYRKNCLVVRLTDYLENSGAVRDYSDGEAPESEASTPIVPVEAARRSKRRARMEPAQTRAQKDKNELKENLARIRGGMQESAAAERESGAQLLRQMEPKEQERILREVLQEFLSSK